MSLKTLFVIKKAGQGRGSGRLRWLIPLLSALFWISGAMADGASAHHGSRWERGPDWHHGQRIRFNQRHAQRVWQRNHRWRHRGNGFWWGARDWRYRHRQWTAGVGGLITGIAIGQHLGHDRYCTHDRPDDRRRERIDQHRVTGCYRVERLPGGLERRVPIPLANCR